MQKLWLLGALVLVGVACSSSSTSSNSSNCSCSVSNNGESKQLSCNQSACVAGTTYTCSASAAISQGASCTETASTSSSSSSGTSGTSGTASSSSSSGTTAAATTVPCAYHDFTADKDVTTCDATKQFCLRSYSQSDGPGSNNVCAPFPSGCNGCDCASSDADTAWKAANDGTNNCEGALVSCNDSDGAVIVDCIK